jgi:hypothetical protein
MDMYCFDLMERLCCEEKATRFVQRRRNLHKKRRELLAALWCAAVRVRGTETLG